MNDMRKLMEAVELNEGAVDATAYIIYDPAQGYYQSPGYYTGNLALAKFYAKPQNAERQRNAFYDSEKKVPIMSKKTEIWEVRVVEVKQVK